MGVYCDGVYFSYKKRQYLENGRRYVHSYC